MVFVRMEQPPCRRTEPGLRASGVVAARSGPERSHAMAADALPKDDASTGRKVPQRARGRRPVAVPEYLPARMLNEFVYCPRLFFYEWIEGVFAHSGDTVEGALRHDTLGEKPDALPPA